MLVSGVSFIFIIAWALFVTVFYKIVYRKSGILKSWWAVAIVFALNMCFFAWGIILFLVSEFIRHNARKA